MAPLAPIVWSTPGKREHSATLGLNQDLFANVIQLYSLDGEQRQLRRAGGDSRLDLVSPVLPLLGQEGNRDRQSAALPARLPTTPHPL